MMLDLEHLEPLATQAATRMVGTDTTTAANLTTQSLMVLTEKGLFAFGLFLVTRQREQEVKAADDIHQAVTDLLHKAALANEERPPLSPDYYRDLTKTREGEDPITALQRILLTKQTVETALTCGRTRAKAEI